jgi:hypothetical protein
MSGATLHALSAGADALLAFMRTNGDALVGTIEGDRHYWALTIAGLAVERRFVSQLKAAGLLEPFGPELVAGLPSCLVVMPGK